MPATLERHHQAVVSKLHPSRVRTSPRFTAILACLLDQEWTWPRIEQLTVTCDGFLLAMREGDVGFNDFIGGYAELVRNLEGIGEVAGLSEGELDFLVRRAAELRRA